MARRNRLKRQHRSRFNSQRNTIRHRIRRAGLCTAKRHDCRSNTKPGRQLDTAKLNFHAISSPIRSRKRSTSGRCKLGKCESSEHFRRKRLPNSELHLLACIQGAQRHSRNDARKSDSTSPIPMVRGTRRTTTRAQSRLRTAAIKRSPNRRSNHPINNLQRTTPTNKLKVA